MPTSSWVFMPVKPGQRHLRSPDVHHFPGGGLGWDGTMTATSQSFLQRKSTFVHQRFLDLILPASCGVAQRSTFPISSEREGTAKRVSHRHCSVVFHYLLLSLYQLSCNPVELLAVPHAVRPTCVLCDRAATSQHIVALVNVVSTSAKPQSS